MNKLYDKTRKATTPRKVRRSQPKPRVYHLDFNVDDVILTFNDLLNDWNKIQKQFPLNDMNEGVLSSMRFLMRASEANKYELIKRVIINSYISLMNKYGDKIKYDPSNVEESNLFRYFISHLAFELLLNNVVHMVTGKYLLNDDGQEYIPYLFSMKNVA